MGLSADLISQFVKATKDTKETKKETTTVYGQVTGVTEGQIYVRFDGAEESTPVASAVDVEAGHHVIVTIKNHSATITSNLTDHSASSEKLSKADTASKETQGRITDLEIAVADRVTTKTFNAAKADIETLQVDTATIQKSLTASKADISTLNTKTATISGELSAAEANIKDLEVNKLDVEAASSTYATIKNLTATDTKVNNLQATHASFEEATAANFKAKQALIDELNTKKLNASEADVTYAKIAELDTERGRIDTLESNVGDIDNLIFGSASGSTIQASFANAVIAQLSAAQIKSAMIESISAEQITAGDINTNNVRVVSEDGRLVISDETIQISDGVRVRVQIGKDASNDYSINIWDADGNLMFSEGGITDSAIKEAIIRDDMVSESANISASKLNIDSLFEEINGSSKTIKSTRIFLDDESQSLDVAFKEMSSDVAGISETVNTQGTSISAIQGKISSKVWKQDITSAINAVDLGGRNYFVRKNINNLAWGSGNTLLENPLYRGYSFPVVAGETWALYRTEATNNRWGFYWLNTEPVAGAIPLGIVMRKDDQAAGHVNYFTVPSAATWAFIYLANDGGDIPNIMLEKTNKASDWTPAPEDVDDDISTLSTQYSSLEQTVDGMSATVASHTSAISNKADRTEVSELSSKVTEVEADLEGFKTSVSGTYVTSSEMEESNSSLESTINQNTQSIESLVTRTNAVESKFNNYSTTSEMQSAINQKADSITSSVRATYATLESVEGVQDDIDNLEIGGRNYFRPSKTVDLGCTGLASGEQSLISTGACIGFYIPVNEGETWSLSRSALTNNRFDWCYTIEEPANGVLIYGWNSGAREQLRVEGITVPANSGYKYLFLYLSNQNDELPEIKLERGTRSTDWTPAPEDMATSEEVESAQSSADDAGAVASNAETLVKQLTDSISTLVTDGNGTSLMTQTENGWTFSTADIQSSVNDISENLNSLTTEMGDANSAIDILQQAVKDLGEIAEYVYITTYEDEPCIELGEGDSDFKLRITNTRMMFTEGSTVLAYFTNQAFNSKKVVIEEELQQGGFVWKVRSNGNLGLTWKGGNS